MSAQALALANLYEPDEFDLEIKRWMGANGFHSVVRPYRRMSSGVMLPISPEALASLVLERDVGAWLWRTHPLVEGIHDSMYRRYCWVYDETAATPLAVPSGYRRPTPAPALNVHEVARCSDGRVVILILSVPGDVHGVVEIRAGEPT